MVLTFGLIPTKDYFATLNAGTYGHRNGVKMPDR